MIPPESKAKLEEMAHDSPDVGELVYTARGLPVWRIDEDKKIAYMAGASAAWDLAIEHTLTTLKTLELHYACEGGISPEEYADYLEKELKGIKGHWSPNSEKYIVGYDKNHVPIYDFWTRRKLKIIKVTVKESK